MTEIVATIVVRSVVMTGLALHVLVTEVLTFLFKTIPRKHREWREYHLSDYKLARRLRQREYYD